MISEFAQKVYVATKRIPRGRVSTYGAVARVIGRAGAARAVGGVLNKNVFKNVPCHRVVRSGGEAGGYKFGTERKIKILKKEGVRFLKNKKVERRFLWLNPFN